MTMPGRTIASLPTSLRLTLSNEGEQLDSQLAASGEAAIKVAVLMIASRDELRHGDQLTVRVADDGADGMLVRGLPRPQGGDR
jgi:hypothetical protein